MLERTDVAVATVGKGVTVVVATTVFSAGGGGGAASAIVGLAEADGFG